MSICQDCGSSACVIQTATLTWHSRTTIKRARSCPVKVHHFSRISAPPPSSRRKSTCVSHHDPHFVSELRNETGEPILSLNGPISWSGQSTAEIQKILSGNSKAIYAETDYLLFNRSDLLYTQHVGLDRLELTGEPIQLLENALTFGAGTIGVNVSASLNGVLAYRAGVARGFFELAWFDRSARRLSSVGTRR